MRVQLPAFSPTLRQSKPAAREEKSGKKASGFIFILAFPAAETGWCDLPDLNVQQVRIDNDVLQPDKEP